MEALIIIDIQNGLTKKKKLYNEDLFINRINSLIEEYRNSGLKIVFVQHNNNQLQEGSYDWEIDERINKKKDDQVIQKKHGNAFQDTDLKTILTSMGVQSLTVCGLVSHGCIMATCLGAIEEGFDTSLLSGGHTNWNKDADIKIALTEKKLTAKGVKIKF